MLEANVDGNGNGNGNVSDRRIAYIHSSDRVSFRNCRRAWNWSSPLRGNRGQKVAAGPLWFGSAIHFALEDFHGYNTYGDPVSSLAAYVYATKHSRQVELPAEWLQLWSLGINMLNYYQLWLEGRPKYKTYWKPNEDGELEPQVEVHFQIKLPLDEHYLRDNYGVDEAYYAGTIDRVVEDAEGNLWLVDYKTAVRFETHHLDTDTQISAYTWAASILYNRPVRGLIYQQHRKVATAEPKLLRNGTYSTARNQQTSHRLYKRALTNLYGHLDKAPIKNIEYLNYLATTEENEDRDRYIRRDKGYRSPNQIRAQQQLIMLELEDMLNPNLPLYPNPSRMGCRMCAFKDPCIALDDNSDWELLLEESTVIRNRLEQEASWRELLPAPEDIGIAKEEEPEPLEPLDDAVTGSDGNSDDGRGWGGDGEFGVDVSVSDQENTLW